jgi:pilus assembly protein Flp/PilA
MIARAKQWAQFASDTRAVTALEYGLIAGIIVLTVLIGFNNLGRKMQTQFNNVAAKLNAT